MTRHTPPSSFWRQVRTDVLRDIRSWPGGLPLTVERASDTFSPTTLHVLSAEMGADVPELSALLDKAQTPQWSRADADAVCDLFTDWLHAAKHGEEAEAAFWTHVGRQRRGRQNASARTASPTPYEQLIAQAMKANPRATPTQIAGWLLKHHRTVVHPSNVSRVMKRVASRKG